MIIVRKDGGFTNINDLMIGDLMFGSTTEDELREGLKKFTEGLEALVEGDGDDGTLSE